MVLELEGTAQEEFTEFVADAEFVSKRVARPGPVVGHHAYERMAVAAFDDFKPTVAGEAMLGHRAFDAFGVFPGELFAVRIVAAHEWEEDRVTAADEADLVGREVCPGRPMQDFPVTGGKAQAPAEQPGAARETGLIGRRTDSPTFHGHAIFFVALHVPSKRRKGPEANVDLQGLLLSEAVVANHPLRAASEIPELGTGHEEDAPIGQPFAGILWAVGLRKNSQHLVTVGIGVL